LASQRNAYSHKGLTKSSYFLHATYMCVGVVLASARGEKRWSIW